MEFSGVIDKFDTKNSVILLEGKKDVRIDDRDLLIKAGEFLLQI